MLGEHTDKSREKVGKDDCRGVVYICCHYSCHSAIPTLIIFKSMVVQTFNMKWFSITLSLAFLISRYTNSSAQSLHSTHHFSICNGGSSSRGIALIMSAYYSLIEHSLIISVGNRNDSRRICSGVCKESLVSPLSIGCR